MRIRKCLSLALAAALVTIMLTGCPWDTGEETGGDSSSSSSSSSSGSQPGYDEDDTGSSSRPPKPEDPEDPEDPEGPEDPENPEDPGPTLEEDGYKIEEDGSYTVANADGLAAWANALKGDSGIGCTLQAGATIQAPADWTSITSYSGQLNGNGSTITGLTQPLFDTIAAGGAVRNLTVNVAISAESTMYNAAGMANTNRGSIIGCTVAGSVRFAGDGTGAASGVADTNYGDIIGCLVTADLTGKVKFNGDTDVSDQVSGIACTNYGDIQGCAVTGTLMGGEAHLSGVSHVSFGTIKNCYWSSHTENAVTSPVGGDTGTDCARVTDWNSVLGSLNSYLTSEGLQFTLEGGELALKQTTPGGEALEMLRRLL